LLLLKNEHLNFLPQPQLHLQKVQLLPSSILLSYDDDDDDDGIMTFSGSEMSANTLYLDL